MGKETSHYLDLMRFLAAVEVLIDHGKRESITGGFLYLFGQFGQEAVAIFFVISGVVISHAVTKRQTTAREYATARLSRLWSVVVPAIGLTIVLDLIGSSVAPALYANPALPPMWAFNLGSLERALAPILFVNQIGSWHIVPGTNGPFWSLGYEFWYYAAFGVVCFVAGIRRYVLLVLVALLVGLHILFLAPIWALGVAAHHTLGRGRPSAAHWLLWCASGIGMLAVLALKYRLFGALLSAGGYEKTLWEKYPIAILFTINLIAFDRISPAFRLISDKIGSAIRACAARTFSLYLYQAPLLFFFGALTWHLHDQAARTSLVYAGTLLSVIMLSEVTETRRRVVARLLDRVATPNAATCRQKDR